LSKEKSARSVAAKALAKEKAAHLAAKQALKAYDEAKAKLAQTLETTKAIYTVTRDKLASKSNTLDDTVIQEQRADTLREKGEEKLADV
jgi:hypothetical protein